MKDRVSNGRMCCKEPLMLRSGRLQSRQVAGRARGAGLPAPGLAEGRAHCGANRVGACCGEGQGAEQAHLAGEEGRSSRSPMDQKTYNNRSGSRSGGSRNVPTGVTCNVRRVLTRTPSRRDFESKRTSKTGSTSKIGSRSGFDKMVKLYIFR